MMSENTKRYKTRLLHFITGISEGLLERAVYQSSELKSKHKRDKTYRTDIIVKVENHILNIEMNARNYLGLKNRNANYIYHICSERIHKGENYIKLDKVIQINLDLFHQFGNTKFVYQFMMREKDTNQLETENLESYHLDLLYLKEKCYNKEELEELEKLCLLFVESDLNTLRGEPIMDEAINEIERISKDQNIIGLYDVEKHNQKVINSVKEEGKIEGITETQKMIAHSLLKNNVDLKLISEATKLSIEELNHMLEDKIS